MDAIAEYSHPKSISAINFSISNYQGVSVHIQLNSTLRDKRIHMVLSGRDCLPDDTPITPEAADDLHASVIDFPLSEKAHARLLEQINHLNIDAWKPKYFADRYPLVHWRLSIAYSGAPSVSRSGTSSYPAEWNQLMQLWIYFARLNAAAQIMRIRMPELLDL